MTAVARQLRGSFAVLGNRDIRRLELGFLLLQTSAPAYWTVLAVFAHGQGGAKAVGLVGLASMAPAAIAAPLAGILADRCSRVRVSALAAGTRAALLVVTSAAMAGGLPLWVVALCAAGSSMLSRVYFPAQAALLPSIARSEKELTSAIALGSTIENIGCVAGPALGGLLLLLFSPAQVTLVCGLAVLAAALSTSLVREPTRESGARDASVTRDLIDGLTAIRNTSALRIVIPSFALLTAIFGLLTVVIVELALRDLSAGDAGVGVLTGALGVGGVIGGIAAVGVTARLPLGRGLRYSSLLMGVPLVLLAAANQVGSAVLLLTAVGIGSVMVDVTSYALIQTHTPDELRGRVFGALEGAAVGALALGYLSGGAIVSVLGTGGALTAAGVAVALLSAITWSPLALLDGPSASHGSPALQSDTP